MAGLEPVIVEISGNERFKRLLSGAPQTRVIKSGYVVLNPGESVGEHKTENKEEVIIVLEGEAEVFIAGKLKFTAKKNNLIYIPPETNHNITNTKGKKLRYIYIVALI